MNNYLYGLGEDTENDGLMIPRYKALGRTAPDGKVYSERPILNPNEDDFVPVRSIITKSRGDLLKVTPDLIGKKFKDFTEGAAIGISFATSLTENVTQSALGLKHGGHERMLSREGILRAPKACEFREEGKWIYLKSRGADLKYPRPDNFITVGAEKKFKAGDMVGSAYETTSALIKLNSLIKLMKAKSSSKSQKYFEKDIILPTECYSYNSGIIKYVEDSYGDIEVWIGGTNYNYSPTSMYYYPEGTEIKKFQRFCSGLVDMDKVLLALPDLSDSYQIFRRQFYYLTDQGYSKDIFNGVTDLHSMQEELIELLYASLVDIKRDKKNPSKLEEISYMGTHNGILNKDSFYTTLSYGYANKVVDKALKGEVKLGRDLMTETILGLLLNDRLD